MCANRSIKRYKNRPGKPPNVGVGLGRERWSIILSYLDPLMDQLPYNALLIIFL